MVSTSTQDQLRPVLAAISSSVRPVVVSPTGGGLRQAPAPFVTISRQAGAGGTSLAGRLVERLNLRDQCDPPWKRYDRELIDKTAADHHVSQRLIESLVESGHHTWLDDLFAGLWGTGPEPSELSMYRRVAQTIRELARQGRAVIVGRGGVYVTRDLPGGVHVRLIAPLDWRIHYIAQSLKLSQKAAAEWVRQTDLNREAFYARLWGQRAGLLPELFTVTLNTAAVDEEAAVQAIVPLVAQPAAVAR